MARTELPNGVILPAEYSDDWYEDMTSNLSKLDDVIGSDSEKLNADGVDFLRMSSAALTDGGTGNFSDLNSSYKLKTGDFILDSGRKLYQIVSVNSTTETFSVGNSLFKVTAESDLAPVAESGDYDDLDNKPDLNPYDQHIANTDIHVTAADKNRWNNQTYVFRYSSTALVASSTNSNTLLDNTDNLKVGDKVIDSDGVLFSITAIDTVNSTFTIGSALIDLALDANVVHTSGDETVDGNKTFSKYITSDGSNTGDEYSNNSRTNLWLMGNRDTEDVSGVLFDTFRQNTAQGTGLHILGFGIKENSVRYEGCRFSWLWDNNLSGYTFDFKPTTQGTNQAVKHNLGTSTDKWDTINGINPGALSLPDLSNGIDISAYISVTGGQNILSTYTAPADGWISINLGRASGAIAMLISNGSCSITGRDITFPDAHRECSAILPVFKNDTVTILSNLADSILWAKFYPCQGNV